MGIDVHVMNFLLYCRKQQPFGRMVTLGRQAFFIHKWENVHITGDAGRPAPGAFSEEFLTRQLDVETIESYDHSAFEGATYLADFNVPLGEHSTFDTVVNSGTIEHIFNVAQALQNMAELCQTGGQLIHICPANNFCGHGFWQMSPELFFALYNEANGFRRTEVFVADLSNETEWFEVKAPTGTERAEITSRTPVYVLCRTTMHIRRPVTAQQSDYVHLWKQQKPPEISSARSRIRSALRATPLGDLARTARKLMERPKNSSLSSGNPHLTRRAVADLLRK